MKLQMTNKNPCWTNFVDENHYQMYSTHTPIRTLLTTIKRAEGGGTIVGTIQWNFTKKVEIIINGVNVEMVKLASFKIGRPRTFTASNGLEYRWDQDNLYPLMTLVDEPHTVIAKYHGGSLGLLPKSKSQMASLDISPEGEDILDDIIVTFVFYEHMRHNM